MKRFAFAAAAGCLFCALMAAPASPQTKPAAPAAQTPAEPAKWVPPVKGQAYLEVIQGKSKRVGNEIHTTLKVKNISKGSIALLQVEEFWYNTKRDIVSNDRYVHKKLINPGEIIEFTMHSASKPDLYTNMYTFKHANGSIDIKKVAKF
jgi:hypothetical protein